MNQEELFQALRAFYPTRVDDRGEPEEFTRIERLTVGQFEAVLNSKWDHLEDVIRGMKTADAFKSKWTPFDHLEDLTQEIRVLSVFLSVKLKE